MMPLQAGRTMRENASRVIAVNKQFGEPHRKCSCGTWTAFGHSWYRVCVSEHNEAKSTAVSADKQSSDNML